MMKRVIMGIAMLAFAGQAYAAPEQVDELNDLLQGEISAVETYRQAIDKVGQNPNRTKLQTFKTEHEKTVAELKSDITRLGGEPTEGSGAWGTWAKTVQGTANVLGAESSFKALKEGEEEALEDHKEIAADSSIPAEIRQRIRDSYIPKQQARIESLDQMIEKVS